MGQRRQAERAHHRDALLIHQELIDGSFVAEDDILHSCGRGLQLRQQIPLFKVYSCQIYEDHGNGAELGQPRSLTCLKAIPNDLRDTVPRGDGQSSG